MLPTRKPNRLAAYDYGKDNLYFVTPCVNNHICCLGHIKDGMMCLNEYGAIVRQQWLWLAEKYPYVRLHAFVVMPNHMHGILEINCYQSLINEMLPDGDNLRTGLDLSLRDEAVKIKSLDSLIGAFKTTSSKAIHKAGLVDFKWQRSYWDHIIRDEVGYVNISHYIDNNPATWSQDKFFTQ